LHQHDGPGCDFEAEEILAAHGLSGRMFRVDFAHETIARAAAACKKALERPVRVTHIGLGRGKVERVASSRRPLGVNFLRTKTGKLTHRNVFNSNCLDSEKTVGQLVF
jgi:hypothetical protein